MSLGNIWIHPNAQFNISKPTLAFIQMPQQTVNTERNSVAGCQYPYNVPSATLSKRSNPYEGFDSVEKKLKVPEASVLMQMAPQIAPSQVHSIPMVSFQGFQQSLAPKPQESQPIVSWRALENASPAGYIKIVPQNIPTQVYQQIGGQVPIMLSNAPNQLAPMHVQTPSSFQVVAPSPQAYVIAEQSNWNFTGNYIGHQNIQILNGKNLNLDLQQIQLPPSQSVQQTALASSSLNVRVPQFLNMMNIGSFQNLDGVKIAKKATREAITQKDSLQIKNIQYRKTQIPKVPSEKDAQGLESPKKKEDRHGSAFLNKRKNWKRVENKLGAELSKTETEIVLSSAEPKNQAETLPLFEDKPVGKNSPISVDSAESTTLGSQISPSQDETPSS